MSVRKMFGYRDSTTGQVIQSPVVRKAFTGDPASGSSKGPYPAEISKPNPRRFRPSYKDHVETRQSQNHPSRPSIEVHKGPTHRMAAIHNDKWREAMIKKVPPSWWGENCLAKKPKQK